MIIGIAMVLMLCITPVAASYDDWEIVVDHISIIDMYTYRNIVNPVDEYGVFLEPLSPYISLNPNLSLAVTIISPVMGTGPSIYLPPDIHAVIYLPCCIKEWQIKYYFTEGGLYTAYFKMTPDGPE